MKKISKNTLIKDCGLSIRAQNILYNQSESMGVPWGSLDHSPLKIGDLKNLSLLDLRCFRNCGDKTVKEIVALAERAGVKLKKSWIDNDNF